MGKRLHLLLAIIIIPLFNYGQITFTSTSNLNPWSPTNYTNGSGAPPTWEASGSQIVSQQAVALFPEFNFSTNNGSEIIITCTDPANFSTLTELFVSGKGLVSLDISDATSLTRLSFRDNNITVAPDISMLSELTQLYAFNNNLSSIDISQNTKLTWLSVYNNDLPSEVLDKIVNDLDTYAENTNPSIIKTLNIRNNLGNLTNASFSAYLSLISKGWIIDIPHPGVPSTSLKFVSNSNLNPWSPSNYTNSTGSIPTWKAEGDQIASQQVTANFPNFDFSANDGSEIIITCTTPTNFSTLTELFVSDKGLTELDVSNATALTRLSFKGNNITTAPDISMLSELVNLYAYSNSFSTIDISQNTKLTFLAVQNNQLTSAVLDKIVNDLDAYAINIDPQIPKTLNMQGNPGSLTTASFVSYNNLVAKGWTISVPAPAAAPVRRSMLHLRPTVYLMGMYRQ